MRCIGNFVIIIWEKYEQSCHILSLLFIPSSSNFLSCLAVLAKMQGNSLVEILLNFKSVVLEALDQCTLTVRITLTTAHLFRKDNHSICFYWVKEQGLMGFEIIMRLYRKKQ